MSESLQMKPDLFSEVVDEVQKQLILDFNSLISDLLMAQRKGRFSVNGDLL